MWLCQWEWPHVWLYLQHAYCHWWLTNVLPISKVNNRCKCNLCILIGYDQRSCGCTRLSGILSRGAQNRIQNKSLFSILEIWSFIDCVIIEISQLQLKTGSDNVSDTYFAKNGKLNLKKQIALSSQLSMNRLFHQN